MSAQQRTELLNRIAKNDLNKKISCEECVNIASDLNLSLQQVSVLVVFFPCHVAYCLIWF